MVTIVPTGPLAGKKEVITGGGYQVNVPREVFPEALVTVTSPVAPVFTTAVMLLAEFTV
jgi:hypothetical protein